MSQVKRAIRSSRTSPPASFQIRCVCGDRIEGLRREDFQVLTCPSCGSSIFVLGQSPLPTPRPPAKQPAPAHDTTKPARRRHTVRARARLARRRLRAVGWRIVGLRRWFTLPVLVGLAALAVTLGTFLWQWEQYTQTQMSATAMRSGQQGLAALAEGDLTKAQKELSRAATLLANLKQPLQDQRTYLQAAKETELTASLPARSLQEILREATMAADPSTVLGDRSFLYEGTLLFADSGRLAPITVGRIGEESIHLDLAGIPLFEPEFVHEGTRVLFGAKMLTLRKGDQEWILEVAPDSAAWITHPALLKYLGLADDSIERTAERQRERLGLPPW